MASLFLLRHPLFASFTVGLGTTSLLATHNFYTQIRRPLLCDSASSSSSDAFRRYTRDADVPIIKNGRPNPAAYRQISSGSILGLIGGLAVSSFSKTLAFLIGLMVLGVQFAASKGYNIFPMTKLQQYFTSIDLRSAVEDNVAFKLSFGATFMLAAFTEF